METVLKPQHKNSVIIWLVICAALVVAMVFVGGYTRLSGSGLSITQWKPIHGVLPPLNDAQWQEEFSAYQATPQYALVNKGMSVEQFKIIFWPEFWHRVLGRIVGIVFLLPLAFFAFKKIISKCFAWRMFGISALVGVQGVVGWVMVASGLVDNPYVSHFKLALHLAFALVIFALILWTLLEVSFPRRRESLLPLATTDREIPAFAGMTYKIWFTTLALQIIFGAFVAGLHAGLIYNTWPDMNGQMLPDGLLSGAPYENLAFIQFIHRTLAVFVALGFIFWWYCHRQYVKNSGLNKACLAISLIIAAQFLLGVLTLVKAVPLHLALTHQMNALLLWAAAVYMLYELKRP